MHLVGAASGVLCGFSVLDESNREVLDFSSFPSISQPTSKQAMPKRASTQPPAPRGTKRLKRTISYVDGFDCSEVSMSDLVATQPNIDQLAEIVNACVMEGDLLWILEPREIIRLMRTCRYMFCFLASFKTIAFRRWMAKNGLAVLPSSSTTHTLGIVGKPFEIGLFDHEAKKVLTHLFPQKPPAHENARWLQTRIQKQESPELRLLARSVAARIKQSKDRDVRIEIQELAREGDAFASLTMAHASMGYGNGDISKAQVGELVRLVEDTGCIATSDLIIKNNLDIHSHFPAYHTTYIGPDVTGDFYAHALTIKKSKRRYTASDRLRYHYFMRRAATNGDSRALLDLAQMYMHAKLAPHATRFLVSIVSFEGLDPFVVYDCGMYLLDLGKNMQTTVRFFDSVQNGHLLVKLGVTFFNPNNKRRNPILALYWFKKALDLGCQESEAHIRRLQSHPVYFDVTGSGQARKWFSTIQSVCPRPMRRAIAHMLQTTFIVSPLVSIAIDGEAGSRHNKSEYEYWLDAKNASNPSVRQRQEGLMLLAQATKKDPQKHGVEFEQEYKAIIQNMVSMGDDDALMATPLFDTGMSLYSKPICRHRLAYMMFRMADRLGDPRAHEMVEVCERKWKDAVRDLL
ncbi:uncharacterized protein BJ171DRAFT_526638 [Polychytrium aggregatum]|uniref:uncharacterized protein n=1 Tax=Polychytrium aggregatum TaxID=110093 RepID=UPI0022FF2D8F|nr:uncharacterized protein BJ171DRAFT_526638 [Polychytrium aggregatum]KAI9193451.1 hypothetical protein BJ171DRAFT_526638 [Polychytrium aggregatum]